MNKDDYQNKIEEHRKPIEINGEEMPNTRKSRRSNTVEPKKAKQKRNYLLPILFIFFILIPVSFLIYVFAFYEPNADETTVLDSSQVQYEQNEKEDEVETETETETETKTETETVTSKVDSAVSPPVDVEPKVTETTVEPTTTEDKPSENISSEQKQETAGTHVVQPGENLYRIALKYYNSSEAVERIKSANGMSSNSISTGQTLVLP